MLVVDVDTVTVDCDSVLMFSNDKVKIDDNFGRSEKDDTTSVDENSGNVSMFVKDEVIVCGKADVEKSSDVKVFTPGLLEIDKADIIVVSERLIYDDALLEVIDAEMDRETAERL